ncbi:hypothetical protein SAMN00777080_3432 [Aquiflexum balticum DSM 16537]|uniref:Uncharacterized protein n=1 Tax=Aquiflexum balticum DSM 16537 TaxID=758820 RepID=A0A1W2H839_9BACT|nr:hypothetical protein SAMN00777080_3432 [Aquiflexum balticum DSM 16537]
MEQRILTTISNSNSSSLEKYRIGLEYQNPIQSEQIYIHSSATIFDIIFERKPKNPI